MREHFLSEEMKEKKKVEEKRNKIVGKPRRWEEKMSFVV